MDYEQAWLGYSHDDYASDNLFLRRLYLRVKGEPQQSSVTILRSAEAEYRKAIFTMTGVAPSIDDCFNNESTGDEGVALIYDAASESDDIVSQGSFSIRSDRAAQRIVISACSAQGILYGVFELLRELRCHRDVLSIDREFKPASPLRMLNHWDNMDGSIERGYSGKSFFFSDDKIIRSDRLKDYARLIASVGINAVAINNVNVKGPATRLITKEFREDIRFIKDIFDAYGIKLFLSLNYASPITVGGLSTADPCDPAVADWWKDTSADIYNDLPGFGGFLVKADSEGRPGPFTYNRDHADGANVIARAVAPFGGIVIWRCFVYNCQQDWRDIKTDRARAQYDNFIPLDGRFDDNVILQIKNGPMDFQVREPVSPLFGGLLKTNEMIEFQIAQEYTGQQKHVCYLIPQFKEVLSFKTYIDCPEGKGDQVLDIVTGRTFGNRICGMCAVSNTGDDPNWTGHDLAAANLYGFGRLAFDPELSSEEIAGEWISLTFGTDPEVIASVTEILMMSWPAYEKYTSPLGIGWMINPGHHYGPNVDGYEYSKWGTYHRADHWGMGVERGSTGTRYALQYNEPNASLYDRLSSCPDELILFFHYLPYTYVLKSGKTMLQHIYDSHFEGVEDVNEMIRLWNGLKGKIDPKRFDRVCDRFAMQLESAEEWRDTINSYFYRKSGTTDDKGRLIYQ